jgi:hypothetical protein
LLNGVERLQPIIPVVDDVVRRAVRWHRGKVPISQTTGSLVTSYICISFCNPTVLNLANAGDGLSHVLARHQRLAERLK